MNARPKGKYLSDAQADAIEAALSQVNDSIGAVATFAVLPRDVLGTVYTELLAEATAWGIEPAMLDMACAQLIGKLRWLRTYMQQRDAGASHSDACQAAYSL